MTLQALLFQAIDGLAAASGLFFVAAGLSLIFGVTRIVNIAHGSLYMLGTYVAATIALRFEGVLGFWGGIVLTVLLIGLFGAIIEIVLLRRIYRAPELFQLLATFALVLIINDAALWIWGRKISSVRARRVCAARSRFLVAGYRPTTCSSS
jgi:branched-chain amino acid transport system permease protein